MPVPCPECGGHTRNPVFREMIRRAAAEASQQITDVVRGRYRPKIEVIKEGGSTHPLRGGPKNV